MKKILKIWIYCLIICASLSAICLLFDNIEFAKGFAAAVILFAALTFISIVNSIK